jgi:type II secretory pathway component PulK
MNARTRPIAEGFARAPRRGSVVIFILGVVLLAAFLITRLMDRAAVELAAEGKASNRVAMRQEAFSSLESSMAVLADYAAVDNGLHAVEQGWAHPLDEMHYTPAPGFSVEATIEDETGKLSLPVADATILRRYLDAIGCPATSLDKLVDSLLTWTRSDHVSENADSDAASMANSALPYLPAQRPLRSFEELRAIPTCREAFFDDDGHWNDLGQRFCAGASVFQFSAANMNSVRPEVLLAFGVDPAQVEALTAARESKGTGFFYGSTADLSSAWGQQGTVPPGLGVDATCFHLKIVVKQGARNYQLDAWLSTGAAPQAPAATPPAGPAAANAPAGAKSDTTASVRTSQRKRIDSPFNILELHENDGT